MWPWIGRERRLDRPGTAVDRPGTAVDRTGMAVGDTIDADDLVVVIH